jgi:hypothetical protein
MACPSSSTCKDSADREPKLAALIQRIKADDTVSYVSFSTPEQLAERVAADWRLCWPSASTARAAWSPHPSPARARARAVHRDDRRQAEVAEVLALLDREDVRLVTLTGPAESARAVSPSRSPPDRGAGRGRSVVRAARARHGPQPRRCGDRGRPRVRDSGSRDAAADLARAVGDRRMLLVLDNFEQILDAAPLICGSSPNAQDDLPRDEPRTAQTSRRARLRRAAARPARSVPALRVEPRWSPPPCGCSATARGRHRRCSR